MINNKQKTLFIIITLTLLIFAVAMAQTIINKIGGTSANEKFQVMDNVGNVKFVVQGNGKVGINISDPLGIFQTYDGVGGFLLWSYDGLNATAQTVIPDCNNDIKAIASVKGLWLASDGTSNGFSWRNVPLGSYVDDTGIKITIYSDGSMTIQGISETLTYKVIMWVMWI